MASAAGIWLATYDEMGQRCWVHNITRQRVYHMYGGNSAPVSPVLAPTMFPHQGMPYNMRSPNMGYGPQYTYPGVAPDGFMYPTSPNGTAGMGITKYPSGSVNWV